MLIGICCHLVGFYSNRRLILQVAPQVRRKKKKTADTHVVFDAGLMGELMHTKRIDAHQKFSNRGADVGEYHFGHLQTECAMFS